MYNENLQKMLEGFQNEVGEEPHVYFQPPENVKLSYPCFVYTYDGVETLYASGKPYLRFDTYTVTYITKKVNPVLVKSMMKLSKVEFDRHFTSENLHHYVFIVNSGLYDYEETVDLTEPASIFIGGINEQHS